MQQTEGAKPAALPAQREVNYQFKLLYAIGMFLVVSGHCNGGGLSLFYDWFTPYGFHMGLFVFCSGYFYKEKSETAVCASLKKKFTHLIVPLYLWNFFYAAVATLLAGAGFRLAKPVSLYRLFLDPILGGELFGYNLGGWFVAPLFMVEAVYLLLRRCLCFAGEKRRDAVSWAVCLLAGFAGVWLANLGWNTGGWRVLTRVACFMPFYAAGHLYKKVLEKRDTAGDLLYYGAVFLLSLPLIMKHGSPCHFEQAWSNYYGLGPLTVYLTGFLGIAFWLRTARLLTPALGKGRCVNWIADNSFSIMVNQFLGFLLLKTVFGLASLTGLFYMKFDWDLYFTDIWYYYIPWDAAQLRILYVAAGLAIPILMQWGVNWLRAQLRRRMTAAARPAGAVGWT